MDIAFATKEATRPTTAPNKLDWNKLARIGRYLAQHPRLFKWYGYQQESDQEESCTDSDGAWVQEIEEVDIR